MGFLPLLALLALLALLLGFPPLLPLMDLVALLEDYLCNFVKVLLPFEYLDFWLKCQLLT
tara:strand:+ start:121 stop:300 length:180 start_codon:yes stop_codon:yes gene_type:complete